MKNESANRTTGSSSARGQRGRVPAPAKPKPRHPGVSPAPAAARPPGDPRRPQGDELEGEGSYSAAQRYREGLEQSVSEGATKRLAEEAAEALDSPEGASLRKAEEAAKHGRSE